MAKGQERQKDPTVVILDEDGKEIVREAAPYPPPTRLIKTPTTNRLEVHRSIGENHTAYHVWIPDVLLEMAGKQILDDLDSGDPAQIIFALWRLAKKAGVIARGVAGQ